MKKEYITILIITIGLTFLFFFPEPETNFIAYFGSILIIVILVILSIIWNKKKK